MKDKKPARELPEATPEQIAIARQLIRDGLGEEYDIEYGCLPRNVGVMGDDGVRGDTSMITSEFSNPAKYFVDVYEQLGKIATAISNQTPTTKVLIDITPADAVPTYLTEQPAVDNRPFIEKVKTRVEGYPHLRRKYYNRLDGDPMLQSAVWAILDVIDARFKAKMAHKFAKDEHGLE